jgi:hypothetical protein
MPPRPVTHAVRIARELGLKCCATPVVPLRSVRQKPEFERWFLTGRFLTPAQGNYEIYDSRYGGANYLMPRKLDPVVTDLTAPAAFRWQLPLE